MTSEPAPAPPGPGLSRSVVAAAACFALGSGTAAALLAPGQPREYILLPLGWATFAVTGAVLLDRGVAVRLGRILAALALVPTLVLASTVVGVAAGLNGDGTFSRGRTPEDIAATFTATAALQAVLVLIGLPLAGCAARSVAVRVAGAAIAVSGALAVLAGTGIGIGIGWAAVVLGCAAVWTDALLAARGHGRTVRRRTAWLVTSLALSGLAVGASSLLLSVGTTRVVATGALALQALWVGVLFLGSRFRPLDEHLLDLAIVVAALAAAGAAAVLVRLGASLARIPSPETSAAMAAVLTVAAAAPAALAVRRWALARRYGPGTIAPSDVAVITADLHARTDPRDLLEKAARMVAAASGCRSARLVLGDEPPEVPSTWVLYPLDVAGERVGTLAVEAAGPDGPEPRQADDVARLVPTVALVARAVALAVEAELARRDVARERDLERRRILADLHDGLGPVLAGMSMRVRAALRANGSASPQTQQRLLADLADGLAESRSDLRRIVSGITPSALEGGDLAGALEDLIASFRGQDGPAVSLTVALDSEPDEPTRVTVYRCVAEGVTNALRHSRATTIAVTVERSADGLHVEVADDGAGGRVVPGVGLTSLTARAQALGGRLTVTTVPGRPGTTLRLLLPHTARIPA